jgi:hypothetical protein
LANGEGLVGEVMGLEVRQTGSMSLSSGAYFRSHSTVSQCARAASAASERLSLERRAGRRPSSSRRTQSGGLHS